MQKKAVILFSGGLDSTTCLAMATSQGFSCYALSFVYGQKHDVEVQRAKEIANDYGVAQHRILSLPMGEYGGSSLTDPAMTIPDFSTEAGIPSTYVPARNTIFLSFALSFGEVVGAYDIFLGVNCVDYSQYPDCRPDYLKAFEKVATLATKAGVENSESFVIHAPLLQMDKSQIIQEGLRLGVDYSKTISCYRADTHGRACGQCDSCMYRKKGFLKANIPDPTRYY